jgi:DNA polymerase-3 subunit epsilon
MTKPAAAARPEVDHSTEAEMNPADYGDASEEQIAEFAAADGVHDAEIVDDGALEEIWFQIIAAAGTKGWTTDDVEQRFAQRHGGLMPATASADQLRAFLAAVKAGDVHGITDEYAAEHGQDAKEGVHEIAEAVSEVVAAGVPLVGHNLGGYDLNLLNHECIRHLGDTLEGVCRQPLTQVIDSMILDWYAAPYRRRVSPEQGPYEMKTTAQTYGLGWDDEQAHGATYDALMSARAAYKIGAIAHTPREHRPEWVQRLRNRRGPYERFDDLAGIDVAELHRRQIPWAAERAAGLQEHFRKTDPTVVIDGTWPLRPVVEAVSE